MHTYHMKRDGELPNRARNFAEDGHSRGAVTRVTASAGRGEVKTERYIPIGDREMAQESTKRAKMICPDCGVEMNFHAEKVNRSANAEGESDENSEFAEAVEEIHTCPGCARIAARNAV